MIKDKKHFFYIGLIIVLVLGVFSSFLDTTTLRWSDKVAGYLPRLQYVKESIQKYNDFNPFWDPYRMGGTPFMFKPGEGFAAYDNLYGMMLVVLPPLAALKYAYILNLILAGISMYVLMYYLTKKHESAFLSAIVFVFHGFIFKIFQWGWLTTINSIWFTPLIILFAIKAFKTKNWLFYSVITSILFSLQVRAGTDLKVFMWLILVFGLYAGLYLLGKNVLKRAVKSMLIVSVVGVLVFGLSAQKILPIREYMDVSVKSSLPYEESASRRLKVDGIFSRLVQPQEQPFTPWKGTNQGGDHLGIIAFFLACYGIYKKRKDRHVIFFTATAVLTLFLATGSFVYYFLWKYIPPFASARYVDRSLIMLVFAGSALAGFGFNGILETLKGKLSLGKTRIVSWVLILLVFLNLAVFSYSPFRVYKERNIQDMIDNNEIMKYISKQPGKFRIHVYETNGIDWGTEYTTVPLGIENIFGYVSSWLSEYMNEFLGLAWREPAKFWGVINTKYVTSRQELNITGLKFVRKFEKCEECFPDIEQIQKIYGPYLYENTEFVPRAFIAGNSILVIGDKEPAKQLMYGLMLHNGFDAKATVIVLKEGKVGGIEFLKKFDAVFLTQGSVDQGSQFLLESYVNNGGLLLPNLLAGQNQLNDNDINLLFGKLNKSAVPVADENFKLNKFSDVELKLPGEEGFLVLSEKYSLFPGWGADVEGSDKELLRANGVVTAVYLDGREDIIKFKYYPEVYHYSKIISIIALLLVLGYLIMYIFNSVKSKNENQ